MTLKQFPQPSKSMTSKIAILAPLCKSIKNRYLDR